MRVIKNLLGIIWTLIFIVLIYMQFLAIFPSVAIMYWWILLGWVGFINIFRLDEIISLVLSLILLIITTAVFSLGFEVIGEEIARLSFVLLLVGLIQSLLKYKK